MDPAAREKEEEERLMRAMEKKKTTGSNIFKSGEKKVATPAATPDKKDEPKPSTTPRGGEPEWKRRQRELEEEKERKLKEEAEALQKRLATVGTHKSASTEAAAATSAPATASSSSVETKTAGSFTGANAGVRAAEEEARIAKTLDTRFSGSRVEQRMKMQEKQEELIADLQAKGGVAPFDLVKYRDALILEINDARTQPKMYVKKLMKLKACFTGRDFIPPSRPQVCIATKEGVKSVTDAIMFMSGQARNRDPIARQSEALSALCTEFATRWVNGGAQPGTDKSDQARLAGVVVAGGGAADAPIELIAASGGGDDAAETISIWLCGDGDEQRTLRTGMLAPAWRTAGIGTATSSKLQRVTVIALAGACGEPGEGVAVAPLPTVVEAKAVVETPATIKSTPAPAPTVATAVAAPTPTPTTHAAKPHRDESVTALAAAEAAKALNDVKSGAIVIESDKQGHVHTHVSKEAATAPGKHMPDQQPTADFAAEGVVRHKPTGTEAALMTFAESRAASAASESAPVVVVASSNSKRTPTPKHVKTETVAQKGQLAETADEKHFIIVAPVKAHKDDISLQACGDFLLLRESFPDDNAITESRWNLPKVFQANEVHARLDGSNLVVTLDKPNAHELVAAAKALEGLVVEFDTSGVASANGESIDVVVEQSAHDVTVTLRASKSNEHVIVSFVEGKLEIQAKRVIETEEDGKRVRVTKTAVESLKLPFVPQAITHKKDDADNVVVAIVKPAKVAVLTKPTAITIE